MDYQAPECKFDFPVAMRSRIVEDVTLHGLTYRCSVDTANAFHDWTDVQIAEWLNQNHILMRAHHDGGWLFRADVPDLSEFAPQVDRWVQGYVKPLLESHRADRIRAEVEAMDWPEVIGE